MDASRKTKWIDIQLKRLSAFYKDIYFHVLSKFSSMNKKVIFSNKIKKKKHLGFAQRGLFTHSSSNFKLCGKRPLVQ